ncbi:hypothetical protein Golomagni_07493 [Golovinomyces magnicellulatus]|nr:hypothetical protein Golomagni_07493 [Golovinomyces magnicellulatus]
MDTKKSNVRLVVAGLLLGLFMAALDQTIVSTAMTKIIERLGGLEKFVWVYSAYMIAMVVATPIFGKLSDMFGRKRSEHGSIDHLPGHSRDRRRRADADCLHDYLRPVPAGEAWQDDGAVRGRVRHV